MKKKTVVIISISIWVLIQGCINLNNLPEQSVVSFRVGEVVTIEPSIEIPFYWNYYIPNKVLKNNQKDSSILLNGAYGQLGRSVEEGQDFTIKHMNEHINYIKNTPYILLAPAIPRRNSNYKGNPWVWHFPNYIFSKNSRHFFRPDLKINMMIDKLQSLLKANNIIVNKKIFVFGYSIGGHFSNRYSILNPTKVKAYAAGGISGELTIPTEEIDGKKLLWPLGISNLEKLTKETFNYEAYKDIPRYIFWGELNKFPYHFLKFILYKY